jgi:hypothetical protein
MCSMCLGRWPESIGEYAITVKGVHSSIGLVMASNEFDNETLKVFFKLLASHTTTSVDS